MNQSPLVSVVIPAYNAAKYLTEAVESLFAQTHTNLQIIIVNDGSKDNTAQVANALAARDARVEVIHKANAGVSAARNDAFRAARGEYICFLDADDVYFPEKVEKQVSFLQQHPHYDLVYANHYNGDEALEPLELALKQPPATAFKKLFVYRNWFSPLAPMLRASLVHEVGLFDETLSGGEDWDYWIRCADFTEFAYMAEPLGIYRQHPQQSHKNQAMMRSHEQRLIQKHYARDSRTYRFALGARNWFYARLYKWYGRYGLMLRELCLFVLNVRNPAEIRLIMKVVD